MCHVCACKEDCYSAAWRLPEIESTGNICRNSAFALKVSGCLQEAKTLQFNHGAPFTMTLNNPSHNVINSLLRASRIQNDLVAFRRTPECEHVRPVIIILVLSPLACQIVPSQCLTQSMAMPLAVVRYCVEQAVFIWGQLSRCCMVCLMPQSQVSSSFEYRHCIMFTLSRPTCFRNRLSAFQVVQGFSGSAGRCSSALMSMGTLEFRGSSRSLYNAMRAAFAIVLMRSVHLITRFRHFRRGTTPRCPLGGRLWSLVCRVRCIRLAALLGPYS